MVFSVDGGNVEKNISANIVEALKVAKSVGARVIGVVSRDGGYTRQVADTCVVVPTVNPATITAHRSIPGGCLARHGEPSEIAGERDEVGIRAMSRPAVFLDLDGVLVEEVYYEHTGEMGGAAASGRRQPDRRCRRSD
jgi:hypothetical protein